VVIPTRNGFSSPGNVLSTSSHILISWVIFNPKIMRFIFIYAKSKILSPLLLPPVPPHFQDLALFKSESIFWKTFWAKTYSQSLCNVLFTARISGEWLQSRQEQQVIIRTNWQGPALCIQFNLNFPGPVIAVHRSGWGQSFKFNYTFLAYNLAHKKDHQI